MNRNSRKEKLLPKSPLEWSRALRNARTPGDRCWLLRVRARMTQEELASVAHSSVAQISGIECGRRKINGLAKSLAEVFEVREEFLLCKDDFETEPLKEAFFTADVLNALNTKEYVIYAYARILGYTVKNVDSLYYSFKDSKGVEVGRCDSGEYLLTASEIFDFAEFKIKKLLERGAESAVNPKAND